MKFSLLLPRAGIFSVFALGFVALIPSSAFALTWLDTNPPGPQHDVWNNSNSNWTGSSWTSGGSADFNGPGAGSGSVLIGDHLNIGSIQFNAGSYTISNTGGYTMNFTGAGISTPGGTAQLISSNGPINFSGPGTTAGNSNITVQTSGIVQFLGTSTAGSATITSAGDLNFGGNSMLGSAVITNTGTLSILGSSGLNPSTASIANGSTFDVSDNPSLIAPGPTGVVNMGALTNTSGGQAGGIYLGRKTLNVGNLTLASNLLDGPNSIDFTLASPGTSGSIVLKPASLFSGSSTGQVDITLSSFGTVDAGTYVLIDWTSAGSSASGVELSDFNLVGPLPGGLATASHLALQGNQLLLVAVPEPASMVMPLVAILGMAWLRRRASRAAAAN